MGVFDSLIAVLSGKGKETVEVKLEPDEAQIVRCVANYKLFGGDLVVTNKRVVFTPLNVADAVTLLTFGLGKAGAGPIAKVPEELGKLAAQDDLGPVRDVTAGQDASWSSPPTIRFTGQDGTVTEIGILASRGTPNFSPTNNKVRDTVVATIRASLPRATP